MPRYDTVLLDADETLWDFSRSEGEALSRTLGRYALPPEARERYLEVNRALWAAFDRGEIDQGALTVQRFAVLCREYGVEADAAEMNEFYLSALGRAAYLLPGAAEFCRALAPCTLAIVTNGLSVAQRGRYVGTGMDKLIPHIFISQEMGARKPQREYFDRVLETLGEPERSRTVVMGDSPTSDILGANRAGLDCIWYNPKGRICPEGIAPTYTVTSYREAERVILGGEDRP